MHPLDAGEGAFLACSFWLVDNYVLQGRYEDARRLFERLLSRCNDVGLLAEELDPRSGRMLGNFPQAYSHVGLINSALNLTRHERPADEHAQTYARHAAIQRPREVIPAADKNMRARFRRLVSRSLGSRHARQLHP